MVSRNEKKDQYKTRVAIKKKRGEEGKEKGNKMKTDNSQGETREEEIIGLAETCLRELRVGRL